MKRFFIDTYRIFLLQTSKVLWDIIGWTAFIWFFFYNAYNDFILSQLSFFIVIASIWLGIRLYYTRGRKNLEEVESIRPTSPFAKGISNILVLFLFFLLICGVTSFLFYNYRLARFVLWVQDYFNTGANLSNEPYSNYINLIKEITPETLKTQKELIKSTLSIFWFFAIPVALAAKLKLIPRIIFIVLFFVLSSYLLANIRKFVENDSEFIYGAIFGSIYLLMFIYLIIPKRINFK